MSNDNSDSKIIEDVKGTVRRLISEGKNILAGNFIACNGNVVLSVTNHSETEYSICYACYSRMWNFIANKSDFKQ